MSKNENCTCKACKTIVFHCQICKFVTFCCRRRRGCVSSLMITTDGAVKNMAGTGREEMQGKKKGKKSCKDE